MAISQAICNSWTLELLQGIHDLDGGDTLAIALYDSNATLGASTTSYTSTNEISGTGYTAGGKNLTFASSTPKLDSGKAILDFDNVTWTNATFTTRGALIYNTSKSNRAVAVLNFGTDVGVSNGDFTIEFPTADASNAIIRLN
jgi:hypothetical protein